MPKLVIILSGHIGSGKTTLATELKKRFGVLHFKTRYLLRKYGETKGVPSEREALQKFGAELDRTTGGRWVYDALILDEEVKAKPDAIVVIDAARIPEQIEAIRKAYGPRVSHIHLTAPRNVLKDRYDNRAKSDVKELKSFAKAQRDPIESAVDTLAMIADIVVDTAQCTEDDVLTKAACYLGLYERVYHRRVDVLVGGQYGSEGKGQIVAFMAREYDLLVRVGGPNAGHKVFLEPEPYTFHHLPSGTLSCDAPLVIAAGAVIHPQTLLKEIGDCKVDYQRLSIDPQTMVIADEDIQAEIELQQAIGSTGRGVGAATARRIANRVPGKVKLARDISDLKPFVRETRDVLERSFHKGHKILLEGTQGTGLSLYHGHYPHVTSRDTTVAGCLAEAGISPSRVRKVVMVCRRYPIRVQSPDGSTSGYMSQEITLDDIAKRSGLQLTELQKTERTSTTNRKRRIAEFDWSQLRRSATLNAPTDVALTFADYIDHKNRNARRFDQLSQETIAFVEQVERVAGAPVSLISTRFHQRAIIDRRSW